MNNVQTILVADDNEAVRGLIAEWLCGAGFEVLTAQDGEPARAVLIRDTSGAFLAAWESSAKSCR